MLVQSHSVSERLSDVIVRRKWKHSRNNGANGSHRVEDADEINGHAPRKRSLVGGAK